MVFLISNHLIFAMLFLSATALIPRCSFDDGEMNCFGYGSRNLVGGPYPQVRRVTGRRWDEPFLVFGKAFPNLRFIQLLESVVSCEDVVRPVWVQVGINGVLCPKISPSPTTESPNTKDPQHVTSDTLTTPQTTSPTSPSDNTSTTKHHKMTSSSSTGSLGPMTKLNGGYDLSSIISHMVMMEQTISGLQRDVQTTSAELSVVKIKLQTTENRLLTAETNLKTHVQTSTSELATVKALQQASETDVTKVKADLKLAKTDIDSLKHDLRKSPHATDFLNRKTELESLKMNHNALHQQINATVFDSVIDDVKVIIADIRSLRELLKTQSEPNITTNDLKATRVELGSLASQVVDTNTIMTQTIHEARLTEKKLKKTKTSLQSTQLDVKMADAHIHTLSGSVTGMAQQLAALTAPLMSTITNVFAAMAHIYTLTGNVTRLDQQFATLKKTCGTDVTFQATQECVVSSLSTDRTMKFDTVDFNKGGGYNKNSGHFTAPVPGTYVFWASVEFMGPVDNHFIYIIKGNEQLASGIHHMKDTTDHGPATVSAVSHLKRGDQVYFTASKTDKVSGHGLSSYGGVLLHTP